MNYNIIISGHFSKSGNFVGINHKKEKIHIPKSQMNFLNLKSIEDIKFPLFAFGNIKTFDRLTGKSGDQNREVIINRNGVKETFERFTAHLVYKDFDSFIKVFTYPISLNLTLIEKLESIARNDELNKKIDPSINSYLEENRKNYLEAEKAFKEFFDYKISLEK